MRPTKVLFYALTTVLVLVLAIVSTQPTSTGSLRSATPQLAQAGYVVSDAPFFAARRQAYQAWRVQQAQDAADRAARTAMLARSSGRVSRSFSYSVRTAAAAPEAPAPGGCLRHGPKSIAEAHSCWDGLIAQYSWPQATMFRIMYCESHADPWARNPSGATGLFQVIESDASTDPTTNVRQAWAKYVGAGYSTRPWVCQ